MSYTAHRMRQCLIPAAIALSAVSAYGQAAYYVGQATIASRQVAPGASAPVLTLPYASVTVCSTAGSSPTGPCVGATQIYSDAQMQFPINQPFIADAQGNYGFFVPPGQYLATVTSQTGATINVPLTVSGMGPASVVSTNGAGGSFTVGVNQGTGSVTPGALLQGTNTNGSYNAALYPGADIGAQANAAIAQSAKDNPSAGGVTVRIPPGAYTLSTTINVTRGVYLELDPGAVLTYTGTGCAIDVNVNAESSSGTGVEGFGRAQIIGSSSGNCGIELDPGNSLHVHGMRISGFKNGAAIFVSGANNVDLIGNKLFQNQTAIRLLPIAPGEGGGYAANAIHTYSNEIAGNTYGYTSQGGCCTQNLGNTVMLNTFEGNTQADVLLDWDYGTSVIANYFESSNLAIVAGLSSNSYKVAIRNNYFTGQGYANPIKLGYGFGYEVSNNSEFTTNSSGCFINSAPGSSGSNDGISGLGTNVIAGEHEFCKQGVPQVVPPRTPVILGVTLPAGTSGGYSLGTAPTGFDPSRPVLCSATNMVPDPLQNGIAWSARQDATSGFLGISWQVIGGTPLQNNTPYSFTCMQQAEPQ